jgi:hypothetical protein
MKTETEVPLFVFRAVVAFDQGHQVFVARCLETGSVAAADSAEMAEDMIKELLIDQVAFAIGRDNLADLYSSSSPLEYWLEYRRAVASEPLRRAVSLNGGGGEVPVEIKVAHRRGR